MRRTRFMSMMFLALSVAFFFLQDFRWGLEVPYVAWRLEVSQWSRPTRVPMISSAKVRALATRYPEDAEALAFAALHLCGENWEEAADLADRAVSRDPRLTWIYYQVAYGKGQDHWTDPAAGPRVKVWISKLQAWDPDNAVPYLLEGEYWKKTTQAQSWSYLVPSDAKAFAVAAQHPEWTSPMGRAYEQPRYDSYTPRRFDLERKVLLREGWATPAGAVIFMAEAPLPSLLNVRDYANFVVFYQGKEAEKAGRVEAALQADIKVSNFGRRMRLGGSTVIENLIGLALDRIASQEMRDLLKRAGRPSDALPFELRLAEQDRYTTSMRKDPLAHSANDLWQATMIMIFGLLVALFGGITLVAVVYVNAKRWIRREKHGRIYGFFTTLENYAPILLFFSCLGLYLFYAPFAQNFHYYMTATAPMQDLEPFFFHAYPLPQLSWGAGLPPENPFHDYLWWAFGIVAVTVLLAWWDARSERRAQAAGGAAPGAGARKA